MLNEKILKSLEKVLENPNPMFSSGVELAQVEAADLVLLFAPANSVLVKKATTTLMRLAEEAESVTARVRAAKALLVRGEER